MNKVLIYGEIGTEVTARGVLEQLQPFAGEPVTVHVNSGGGDVYEGIAVLNALRAHDGEVTVVIDSLAASAASFIAVGAGGRVVCRPNAELMLHRAWTMQMGNSSDLTKVIADLERQDTKLAAIYAERSGSSPEEWLEMMDAETWFTAQEAVDAGLVDAIEDAKQPVSASAGRARVMASYRYSGRSAAPPPTLGSRSESAPETTTPSDGQKGDTVSILNQLAQELGKTPEDVQNALSGFFNETVPISGEVEVTYPADVKIVPTERIKVEPIVGDKRPDDAGEEAVGEDKPVVVENAAEPAGDSAAVQLAKQAGLTFAMGDVAEGFTAEVDEGGVVTITAPSGAEVGSTAEFSVLVNDTPVALSVAVRSLSDEEDTPAQEDAPADTPPAAPAGDQVTLDAATFAEMKAAAQFGWKAMEKDKETKLVAEVDGWIRDGRISAGLRSKAVAAMKRDQKIARDLYGSNPKGTIPRAEVGYGHDKDEESDSAVPSREELKKIAEARRAGKK